jgi:hypothetical protein
MGQRACHLAFFSGGAAEIEMPPARIELAHAV